MGLVVQSPTSVFYQLRTRFGATVAVQNVRTGISRSSGTSTYGTNSAYDFGHIDGDEYLCIFYGTNPAQTGYITLGTALPPEPDETQVETFRNPYGESLMLRVEDADGNVQWYSIGAGESVNVEGESSTAELYHPSEVWVTYENDTAEYKAFDDAFKESIDPNASFTLETDSGTETALDLVLLDANDPAADTLSYTVQEIDGTTWIVQKDSSGDVVAIKGVVDGDGVSTSFDDPKTPTRDAISDSYLEADSQSAIIDQTETLNGIKTAADTTNDRLNSIIDLNAQFNSKLSDVDQGIDDIGTLIQTQIDVDQDRYDELRELSDVDGNRGDLGSAQDVGSMVLVPSLGNYSIDSAAPNLVISLPASMGGADVDLNPFRSDRAGSIASGIRALVTWITLALLALYCTETLYSAVRDMSQAPQAKGNAVLGGTGGQVTALVAAAAITAVIVTSITALSVVLGGDFALPALYSAAASDPFVNMAGAPVWLLDQLFPISLIFGAFVSRIVVKASSAAIVVGGSTVIRFITP